MRHRTPLIVFVMAALVLAGCGSSPSTDPSARTATLVLDFTPNAIHAGIYSAIARGYAAAAGVKLHVVAPPASPDSVKLLESGRANFAILDIHDLALARQDGQDIVGIMAIVEHPLAAVIATPQIRTPAELQGQTVGVTGDPSDLAVLHSVVAGAGGDPRRVKTITIGFDAVPALLAHRVAAATAFWNDEGVTLAHDKPGFHSFRVERYGAPAYPELILCATAQTVRQDPVLARAVVHSIVRGYRFAVRNPEGSEADLEQQVQNLDPRLVAEQLTAELPDFTGPNHIVGELNHALLERWARWEASFGIVKHPPSVDAMFDTKFLPKN
ncbi:MAG TPA: ABC transporter substrate-binding protein [Solirubrobacteraceae bacterium]|nr:ABC transporter substrate-binding protein [Solirubrobacteraceae bacterium]